MKVTPEKKQALKKYRVEIDGGSELKMDEYPFYL